MQGVAIATPTGPWIRRGQLVYAAIAAVGSLAAAQLDSAAGTFGAPLLLMAVRFFELARFRSVHRSGWLLVYSLWTLFGCATAASWQKSPRIDLALLLTTAILGVVLFVQQRDQQRAMREAGLQTPDQDGEDWALGGFLALPFAFLVGSAMAVCEADGTWHLAFRMLALPVLWLQLVRSAWFPGCMILWLIGVGSVEMYEHAVNDRLGLAIYVIGLPSALLIAYLLLHKRVHRTFAGKVTA